MEKDYFKQRDLANYNKLQELYTQLPHFCKEYFIGVSQRTTSLTRLNYAHDLILFFNFLIENISHFVGKKIDQITLEDLAVIEVSDLELYLDYLTTYKSGGKMHSNGLAAKSRKLSTLRSFFKYFYNKNKLPNDVSAKILMPKKRTKPIVRLETDEAVLVLNEAENGLHLSGRQKAFHEKTKTRDLALLTLMLGTGIRISECVGLNVDDVDLVNQSFRVTRKGEKQDILYFSEEVAHYLAPYIEVRKNSDISDPALFLSLQNRRISPRAVQDLVKKYAQIAAPLKNISPHKLRSTYGTNLYRETKDIYVVAEVLGHKDINTTKKHYAAISEDIKRSAASKIVLRDEKEM